MLCDLAYSAIKNSLNPPDEGFDDVQQGGALSGKQLVYLAISIMALIGAAVLSWRCNTLAGESIVMKIVYAVIAALFSYLYLIYYLIVRVFMGSPCA